jgi:hypothetical protein
LTEGQARNAAALDFHFNASLATVIAARVGAAQAQEAANLLCFRSRRKNKALSMNTFWPRFRPSSVMT